MTKKQVKIVKFILGKEEVGGSNPLVGSSVYQVVKYKSFKSLNLSRGLLGDFFMPLFLNFFSFIPSILPRGTPIFSLFWKPKQQKLTLRNPDITQKKGSLFQLMLFVNKMSEFLDPINFLKSYSIYNEFVKSRYFSFTEHRVGLIKRKYLKNRFLVIWRPIANNAIYLSNKTSK